MTLPETGDRGTTLRAPVVPNPVIPEGMGPLLDALRAKGITVLFVMDEPDTEPTLGLAGWRATRPTFAADVIGQTGGNR